MKHNPVAAFLLATLIALSGCEDDKKDEPAPASDSGGGGHTYSWQDPSTVSRSYTYDVVVINTRNQVIPGARNLCTVTMKFNPVRIEEKPSTNTPNVIDTTDVVDWVLYGV